MVNTFMHYDLMPRVTAYAEMHFSTNTVTSRLSPSNINSSMLFNANSTFLTPAMRTLFAQLDQNEVNATTTFTSGAKSYTTTRGDGLTLLAVGRRFTDVGFRIANAQRDAWRFVGGFRGTLPSVSDTFLKDLSYDVYYDYAKSTNTERQQGDRKSTRLNSSHCALSRMPSSA